MKGMDGKRKETYKNKFENSNSRLEAVKVTIEKKKKCDARALEIVTNLSENTVVEECLLKSLQNINQEHYQDVIDERAINKLCGYPLCCNLLKNIPTKQYHISTLHNKVFDITDRKNFCSNLCYKASTYLKDQISTSPLWLRDGSESSTYKLLPLKAERGSAGVEVDFGITSIKEDLVRISNNDNSHSCGVLDDKALSVSSTVENEPENSSSPQIYSENSFPVRLPDNDCGTSNLNLSSGLLECKPIDPALESECKSNTSKSIEEEGESFSEHILDKNQSTGSTDYLIHSYNSCSKLNNNPNLLASENRIQSNQDKEQDLYCTGNLSLNVSINKSTTNDNASCSPSVTQNFIGTSEISTPKLDVKKPTRRKLGKKNTIRQLLPIQNVVIKVEETLKEWFTLESLCLLFREAKVKELLAEKSVDCKEWQNMSGASAADNNFYERYLAICKKLNILELEDTKIDASFREETKKPLPDYDLLKKEAKELDLKVKMFYKGDKVVQFEETEPNSSNSTNTFQHEPVLPLVDLHAQKALRKRIVLDKLRRTLQDLQGSLGIKGFNLSEDVRALISTFTLSAHNVTMKPAEWNLMAIVIIKLLSLRDTSLEQGLKNDCSTKHLALLLMSYSLDSGYLDRLIFWLTDIDSLIKKE